MKQFEAFCDRHLEAMHAIEFSRVINPMLGHAMLEHIDPADTEISLRELIDKLVEDGHIPMAAGLHSAFVQWLWERRVWLQLPMQ